MQDSFRTIATVLCITAGATWGVIARGAGVDVPADGFVRRLEWRDGSLVTTALMETAPGKPPRTLAVESDEFCVVTADGMRLTAADYAVAAADVSRDPVRIVHRRRPGRAYPAGAPDTVEVAYDVRPPVAGAVRMIVKSLRAVLPAEGPAPLAVEVERLRTTAPASRGGRGEPVVLDGAWLFLPLDPSTLTRHTDGNTPAAYGHRFEKVGNHSLIDFEGADVEPHPAAGLVRVLHFPLPRQVAGARHLAGHEVALALVPRGTSAERFVSRSLRPVPRSHTHYNNWFDPAGKNLAGDSLPAVHRAFAKVLEGSGVTLDALVPDNGWQDRRSVWEPSPGPFPGGMADLAALGATLRKQGTGLGVWMSLDQTTNDIGWMKSQGYVQAVPNAYFRRYFPHVSLADEKYRRALAAQVDRLVAEAGVNYFKFDFNHLSHTVPTDRHGHEAELAGMLEICKRARDAGVFVNATNWTWHSPAWLLHADSVWLLAGDDGFNGNWPELAGRAQATTDRDVYLWRMWSDPVDRPWFPISAIMTHGIVRNAGGQMSFPGDTPRDWCDYVLMHYGRGTLLREWYLSTGAMQPHEWRALVAVHRWADARRASLTHACFVGGRPDEGHAYGYVGFDDAGTTGTLVARNPAAGIQRLRVPLDDATLFTGTTGAAWRARIVYPWRQDLPDRLVAGAAHEFAVPGYATVAIELEPGEPTGPQVRRGSVVREVVAGGPGRATLALADSPAVRRELLVIGRPTLPEVLLDGTVAMHPRTAESRLNAFAGYAHDGMPSAAAAPWQMAAFDLQTHAGRTVAVALRGADTTAEAWVIADVENDGAPPAGVETPLTFPGVFRETVLVREGAVESPPPPRRATPEEIAAATAARIELEVFGNDAGAYGAKTLSLGGVDVGELPKCGDEWRPVTFALDAAARGRLAADNTVVIRATDGADKFKVRRIRIVLVLPDGTEVAGPATRALVNDPAWVHAAGAAAFASPRASGPIPVAL